MDMPTKPPSRPPNPNPNPSNTNPSPLPAGNYAPPAGLSPAVTIYAPSAGPSRLTSCAAKAGVRQCWATTLVVKGFLFAVGFTVLALESICYTQYHCAPFDTDREAAGAVYGASVFVAIVSSVQVALGVYATSMVCCPPHTRLTRDYIVWIILTLCEVPGFVAGWAFAFAMWVDSPGSYYNYEVAYIVLRTVPTIALVTSFLIVTATLTHSFRARVGICVCCVC